MSAFSDHWFCKDCIIQNHITRTECLQCGKFRQDVELLDEKEVKKLLFQFNGKNYSTVRRH